MGAVRRAVAEADDAAATVELVAEGLAGTDATPYDDLAAGLGFAPTRTLLRLRRALPVPADHPRRAGAPAITTRPFRAADGPAWIRQNNRAFADHPDQGAETAATLEARLAESWFDPAGFLVVDDPDRPGELAGSCWTKVHPATAGREAVGEIYVIGADPAHHGTGLGTALVLAGLDHLAGRGLAVADLYVEDDNEPARRLYDALGFTSNAWRRIYAR